MKKSLIALAVLGAFASVASAQSSVTLDGTLDAGVRHKGTSTGYDWDMSGTGSAFNRFRLRGTEDLGGGMNAFFLLDHRFRIQNGTINSADYGTGTSLPQCGAGLTPTTSPTTCSTTAPVSVPTFYRQLWVGLGGAFGDVRLGRMLMPVQENNGNFDPWYGGYTVASTHTGGLAATQRANSGIYYRSPSMSGFSVHAAIAAGQGQLQGETNGVYNVQAPPTNSGGNLGGFGERPVGFALNYAAGPLKATVAYDKNYADMKTVGVYGSYNFGVANLNFQFEDGDSFVGGNRALKEKIKAFSIAADIPLGAMVGKVGYLRLNSDRNGQDASKFGLGGEYNLSKRTLIYSDIGKSSGDRLAPGLKKTEFDFGLRHNF